VPPPLPPGPPPPPLPRGPPPASAPIRILPRAAHPLSAPVNEHVALTMASVLSHRVPADAGGEFMTNKDVKLVARYFYHNIATTPDPFLACYYHFALQAKRAAAAAKAHHLAMAAAVSAPADESLAADEPAASNVLDAAALLTAMGTAAAARATPAGAGAGAGGAGGRAAGSAVAAPPRPSAAAAVAAEVLATLPVVNVYQQNVMRNRADLRLLGLSRRRRWETRNRVLGRIATTSVRTMRVALDLSDTGRTSARDMQAGKDVAGQVVAGGGGGGAAAGAEAGGEAAAAGAAMWSARARIDDALATVLQLQDVARRLQAMLRTFPPPPADAITPLRDEVGVLRDELAEVLGLRKATPAAADDAGVEEGGIDDAALLSLLSLPKGKRLLARAVPMLAPEDKVQAVHAGLRHLPHFVASATVGADAEEADAALGGALAKWVADTPPAVDEPGAALAMLTLWVHELSQANSGAIVRALIEHPLGTGIITNLLLRGENESKAVEAARAADPAPAADAEASDAVAVALSAWRAVTDALGRSYMEASE